MSQIEESPLSEAQKCRIEKNRNKAIILKRTRLIPHPNSAGESVSIEKTTLKIGNVQYKDTGGGFLIEENPESKILHDIIIESEPAPILKSQPTCKECQEKFTGSYLFDTFDYSVCNSCRNEEKHSLITKTDAMKEYLLKDCDLDKRTPILKFITRKNPHNIRGQMKLYLQPQVEERALEVWGSEEEIQAELMCREDKKITLKAKKNHKYLKQLRMNVRSSMYDKTSAAYHKHAFGPEEYNEEEDNYLRICTTCGFNETFEKM